MLVLFPDHISGFSLQFAEVLMMWVMLLYPLESVVHLPPSDSKSVNRIVV